MNNRKQIRDFNLLTNVIGNQDNILIQRDNGTTFRVHIDNLLFTKNDYTTAGLSTVSYVDTEVNNLQNDVNNDINNLYSTAGYLENKIDKYPDYTTAGLSTVSYVDSEVVNINNDINNLYSSAGYLETELNNLDSDYNSFKDSKAQANGLASLGADNKLDSSQIPQALLGATKFQGFWNASTNSPTLTNLNGTKGQYYIVSVAGATDLNSITDWKIGDWVIFLDSYWGKVDNTDSVVSVAGKTGIVNLTTSDISEGSNFYYTTSRFNTSFSGKTTDNLSQGSTNKYYATSLFNTDFSGKSTTNLTEGSNLYYTTARFTTDFSGKTTTNLTEGTNLYYTQARFDTAFTAKSTTNLTEGTNLYYTQARFDTAFTAKSTTNLTEGTNLYFTNARTIASTLTSYASSSGTITSADTVLIAIQKLNGNISNKTYTNYTPTLTGFSSNPSPVTSRYMLEGKKCTVYIYAFGGTSNATATTITLPFVAANTQLQYALGIGQNAGTNITSLIRTRVNSDVADLFVAPNTTWSAGGTKSIGITLIYETV